MPQTPLTPEYVRSVQFGAASWFKLRRGYDEDEVDRFLDDIERGLDELLEENRQLAEENKVLRGIPRVYPDPPDGPVPDAGPAPDATSVLGPVLAAPPPGQGQVNRPDPRPDGGQSALDKMEAASRVLAMAQETAASTVAAARRDAEEALARAEQEAGATLSRARREADQVTSDARALAEQLERDVRARRDQVLGPLEQQRAELIGEIGKLRQVAREYGDRLRAYADEPLPDLDRPPGDAETVRLGVPVQATASAAPSRNGNGDWTVQGGHTQGPDPAVPPAQPGAALPEEPGSPPAGPDPSPGEASGGPG